MAHITAEVGYINLLVANAGVGGPELSGPQILGPGMQLAALQKEMWDTDAAAFDNTFDVNVRGVYYTVTAFLPLLEAGNAKKNVEQSSQVVITSSIGGFHRVPFPHFAYCASKAAVTHMGKQMATAFHPYRIRVNILAPGSKWLLPLLLFLGGSLPPLLLVEARMGLVHIKRLLLTFLRSVP